MGKTIDSISIVNLCNRNLHKSQEPVVAPIRYLGNAMLLVTSVNLKELLKVEK